MTISGGINFSGIGNGTDFSQIVDKLKEVESMPMKRMEAWKADWNKRYEAFGEIIAAVREAQQNLTKLNSPQKFLTKIAASSKENIVGAKANADAVDGTHTVKVEQLASNAIWSFNESFDNKFSKVNTSGTAQDFSYTYQGKTRTLSIPNGTTVEGFVTMVNQDRSNPGVKMNLVQTSAGYTIQIQGKESGAKNDLTVHPSNLLGLNGGTSLWQGTNAIEGKELASFGAEVKNYTYTVALDGMAAFDVELGGNASQQDLANAINDKYRIAAGDTTLPGIAEVKNGKMQIAGLQSMTTKVAGSADSTMTGKPTTTLNSRAAVLKDTALFDGRLAEDELTYNLEMADGTTKTIKLAGNASQQQLVDAINKAGGGVSAKVEGSAGAYSIALSGVKGLTLDGAAPGDPIMENGDVGATTWAGSYAAKEKDTLQSGVVPRVMEYSFLTTSNERINFTITNTDGKLTADEIVAEFNRNTTGLKAPLPVASFKDGKLEITNIASGTGVGVSGQGQVVENSKWSIRKAEDAIFQIDNWPQKLTSSTNEVSNVLDGVTLTLKDVGDSQISVSSDRDSVKENIQTVLDTINTVVKKVQDLTKWDSQKQTVDTTGNYGSQFNSEKGSVLTGNYGVQLFNTRLKTNMAGSPPGFNSVSGDDIFSGDFIAALSQMGIKTCSTEGDPNYGLFQIAPSGSSDTMQSLDQQRFDDAISNRLEDVISFFASDDVGSTSSPNFRYANHIKGMTKPGTYGVSYKVSADGTISNVMINGVKANESDLSPGTFTVANAGGASGMSITIDNLAEGEYQGNVSIKQGKVRQMEDFFAAELVYYKPKQADPSISQNNGGLMILQANYMDIMNNIDKKIEREQTRLIKWERTQRLAYSRLETVLGQYERNMQSLSSQMGQLNSQ